MSALILASIGEDDDDTLWINISKIFIQAKSKARKREISPSTDEEDYYTPSRSSLGKSPFKSKAHKRDISPIPPSTGEDDDYTGLLPLDGSNGNTLPPQRSKDDATVTPISALYH